MHVIFDWDGPVMRALSVLTRLIFLNILTGALCVPVVTAGASLTAMHRIIMDMQQGCEPPLLSAFFREFRAELRQATPVWLLFLCAGGVLYADIRWIGGGTAGLPGRLLIPLYVLVFVLVCVLVYALPLMALFENSIAGTLKNALLLSAGYFPRTLLMAAAATVIPCLFLQVSRLLPLFFLAGFTLPAYLQSFLYMPVFRRLIDAQEERTV